MTTGTPVLPASTPVRRPRRALGQPAAMIAIVCVIGVAAWTWIAGHQIPVGDIAFIELKVRAIAAGDLWPQLGSYSRFGWSHPGPAQWYYLTAVHLAMHGSPAAIMTAAIVWQLLMTGLAWWTARRHDPLLGAVILLAAVGALAVLRPTDVVSPWNPLVGAVGTLALVMLAWDASLAGRTGALLTLPLGSFLVQAHVGYAPVVATVCLLVPLLLLVARRYGPVTTVPWRWAASGAAVAGLMWLPPLLQQLGSRDGNMTLLLAEAGDQGPTFGVRAALGTVSGFLARPHEFGNSLLLEPRWSAPLLLILPVVATVVALRRRSWPKTAGLILGWAALGGSTLALSRIHDDPYTYLAHYLPPSALALLAFSGWTLVSLLPDHRRRDARRIAVGAAVALAVLAAVRIATAAPLFPRLETAAVALADQIAQRQPPGSPGIYLVGAPGRQTADEATLHSALMNQLVSRGVDVSVDPFFAAASDPRLDDGDAGRTRITIEPVPGDAPDRRSGDPDVIARFDPWQPGVADDVTRLDRAIAELEAEQGDVPDPAGAEELRTLRFLRALKVIEATGYVAVEE